MGFRDSLEEHSYDVAVDCQEWVTHGARKVLDAQSVDVVVKTNG